MHPRAPPPPNRCWTKTVSCLICPPYLLHTEFLGCDKQVIYVKQNEINQILVTYPSENWPLRSTVWSAAQWTWACRWPCRWGNSAGWWSHTDKSNTQGDPAAFAELEKSLETGVNESKHTSLKIWTEENHIVHLNNMPICVFYVLHHNGNKVTIVTICGYYCEKNFAILTMK